MFQAITTTQFYLYGKKHCTKTGWENAVKAYPQPDILRDASLDLSDKVYMITGANAGIGREITTFLASKSATVYMVCRTPSRAEAARVEIAAATKNDKLHVLLGDCGLDADIRRVWSEFLHSQRQLSGVQSDEEVRLDGLVCNAGAMDNAKKLSAEGVEVTVATHLIFGTYLLGSLALPALARAPDARLVVVSSGGMYNTKFPSWEVATSTSPDTAYDGQMVYAYAKRGQVILCEEWAAQHRDKVKVVSCHPGWTQTEAVDAAYGEKKSYLQPLRTAWEGAEGIVWLLVAPRDSIEDGGFYLDRSPQRKHLPGLLYGETSFTQNSRAEVDRLMARLREWTSPSDKPSADALFAASEEVARAQPLSATSKPLDLHRFMISWHVLANIPTPFEVGAHNCVESYTWSEAKQEIKVKFEFWPQNAAAHSTAKMRARVKNAPTNTLWALDPQVAGVYLPVRLSYLVLDFAEDLSWCVVGVPDRSYLWVMVRDVPSTFTEVGVQALAAYASDKEPAAAAKEEEEQGKVSSEEVRPAVANDDAGAAPPSTEVVKESLVDPDQVQKRVWEKSVLENTLAYAARLGYDTSKAVRVPWHADAAAK